MANRTVNNVKLGVFVLAGLVALIFSLYMIGKDTNLFGKNYVLKARFQNINGLMAGNNVRFSGIQVGSIKQIQILNDTTIEVTMLIEEDKKKFIHKGDLASIGTDGLVGNKLINLAPGKTGAAMAESGDILTVKNAISTEDMMEVLNKTNKNISIISEELKSTVQRVNQSAALWEILNDKTLPANLRTSLVNVRNATSKTDNMVTDLQSVIRDIQQGKGSLGAILKDTAIAVNLNQAIDKIKMVGDNIKLVGDNANNLANELNTLTKNVKEEVNNGKGPVNAALKDSALVTKLNNSLSNIESGTAGFNENMEALKHNFLFKGYFKKLEKQKKKEEEGKAKAKKTVPKN